MEARGGNGGLGQGGGLGGDGGAGQGPTMNHDVTAENFTMVNNLCVGLDLSASLLGSFLRSIPNLGDKSDFSDCSGLSFLEEIIRDGVMNSMASQQAPPSSPKDRNVDSGGRKQWPVYSPALGRRQNSCVYLRDIGRERAAHARKKRRIAADDNLGGKGSFHTVDAPRRRRKFSRSESFDHDSGAHAYSVCLILTKGGSHRSIPSEGEDFPEQFFPTKL
ncbi:hypothetical protein B0H14DRAFT_833402 [Mycena olivaceomarginata]|nr:hypothetical protein B0H14DRAFT_833402 [Mycena olivaceomarginata]